MLKIILDIKATFGEHLVCTETKPYYSYKNNQITDTREGFRYDIVAVERGFEKISVKIAGNQRIEIPENDYVEVELEGFEASVYVMNGRLQISAHATDIKIVKDK